MQHELKLSEEQTKYQKNVLIAQQYNIDLDKIKQYLQSKESSLNS